MIQHYTLNDAAVLAERIRRPFHANYYAMYASTFGGIVTDPLLMSVPIDDHMVHRGDGVFETFKCHAGRVYNMWAHLERLTVSARAIHIRIPWTLAELGTLTVATVQAGRQRDALVRLFISRGPGSFGVNPYDCAEPGLYIAAIKLDLPFMEKHPEGASVMLSALPAKPPFFAGIKSCNYLPNVLMKKEAVDAGVDFVISLDTAGHVAEGATENIGIVTRDRELLFPKLDGVLCGTTMMRVMELADKSVERSLVSRVAFADLTPQQVHTAEEVLIVGTTPNVTFVRTFDGRRVHGGKPGPVYARLSALLLDDIHHNRALQTPVEGLSA